MMNDELGMLFVKELSSSAESAEETELLQWPPLIHKSSLRHFLMKYASIFAITIHNMVSSLSRRDLVLAQHVFGS